MAKEDVVIVDRYRAKARAAASRVLRLSAPPYGNATRQVRPLRPS